MKKEPLVKRRDNRVRLRCRRGSCKGEIKSTMDKIMRKPSPILCPRCNAILLR